MATRYEQRQYRATQRDPQGFAQYIQRVFGHSPAVVSYVLDVASRLSQPCGGTLTAQDIEVMQQMYPRAHPGFTEAVCSTINKAPPGVRADGFIAAVVGDDNAWLGNFPAASPGYRKVQDMVERYTVESYADELNRRRGGSEDAPPPWRPQPASVRGIVEAQFRPQGAEAYMAVIDEHPEAAVGARNALADRLEQATDRLGHVAAGGDLSMRDTVEAAYDTHAVADIAAEQFGISDGSKE